MATTLEGIPIFKRPNLKCRFSQSNPTHNKNSDKFLQRCHCPFYDLTVYPKQEWVMSCPKKRKTCEGYIGSIKFKDTVKKAIKECLKETSKLTLIPYKPLYQAVLWSITDVRVHRRNTRAILKDKMHLVQDILSSLKFGKIKPSKKMRKVSKVWYGRKK